MSSATQPQLAAPRTPTDLDRRIEGFRRRVAWVGAWVLTLRWSSLALLGWGLVILVLRAGFGVQGAWWLAGLALVPVLAVWALGVSWRRRPDPSQVRALFDRHHRRGGVWMLETEGLAGVEPWIGDTEGHPGLPGTQAETGPDQDPKVRWRSRGDAGRLAAAIALVAATVLLPTPKTSDSERPLALDHRIETLEEQVETLAEEELIEPETREALETTLEKVVEEASAESPARTWEALDHLAESLERRAEEGVEEALTQGQQLSAMDRVAERLAERDAALDDSLREGALAELRSMTAEAASQDRLLGDRLARELAAAAEELGQGEAFDRLRAALGEGLGELGDGLERLRQAGLIDLERLQDGKRILQERDDSELIGFLVAQGRPESAKLCEGPGRGGITRGPGHAPLSFDNDSSPEGVELRPEVLPPDAVAALEQSRLLGVSMSAPGGGPEGVGEGGALEGAAAGRGGAHTRVILPQHRRAVARFFDREAPQPSALDSSPGESQTGAPNSGQRDSGQQSSGQQHSGQDTSRQHDSRQHSQGDDG